MTITFLSTRKRPANAQVRMPQVQPVHGRRCTCHRCAKANAR